MKLPHLKLKNDVATYEMIKRVLILKNALISTFAITNSSWAKHEDSEKINVLTNVKWTIVVQSMEFLEIFDVGSEYRKKKWTRHLQYFIIIG